MSRHKKSIILALGLVLSTVFLGMSFPAIASTQQLPSGQSIVAVPCEPSPSSLYEFDLTSESVSPIGATPIGPNVCIAGSVLDPITGELIAFDFQENNWNPTVLIRLDPATGETLGNINLVIDEAADNPDAGIVPLSGQGGYMIDSISIDSLGNLFVFLDDHKLYYASPTQVANTFELRFLINTPRLALASSFNPIEPGSIYALFQDNPGTDRFYKFSISYAGSIPQSATMGSAISSQCDFSCFAISFDESGVAWIQNERFLNNANQIVYGIYTTSFESANPTYTYQSAMPWYFYSLAVVPSTVLTESNSTPAPTVSPALANTGFNPGSFLGAGLATLVIGSALVVLVRFRLFRNQ